MEIRVFSRRENLLAAIGALLLIPAVLVFLAGVLDLRADLPLIHPVLVLGGLAFGFLLNVLAAVALTVRTGGRAVVAEVRLKGSWLNLVVAGISLGLTAALGAYAFGENFVVMTR